MSEIMLHGILNMPLPDQPADCDIVTWVQFKAAARDASARIEKLEAKLDLSEGALDIASRSWGECQRILEQTEAKLAKAVEALAWCSIYEESEVATATIAELKGDSDE